MNKRRAEEVITPLFFIMIPLYAGLPEKIELTILNSVEMTANIITTVHAEPDESFVV